MWFRDSDIYIFNFESSQRINQFQDDGFQE